MAEYLINVGDIEALQMINDRDELERIFTKAKSTVVQGSAVVIARQFTGGKMEPFDEITTEADLETYKESVFKHLK
ncbi:hypothetical protein EXU57_02740 [Segetibacter sp. 3557_3]|uniref:hypothetical protein n=1 Tax=Segetibacter sp. 3557_3 TaxID=2547429 RepID=UPI0010590AF9|nr:hypothetical protein [Segetibacter sp. 3557_3]TDH29008.1 hypothetical protein EXU57_02740 [Segetibacter sp. 3557_3]